MNLPDFVLACPATLALIVRAKVTGEFSNACYDDAFDDALKQPAGYEPSEEVQAWMRVNWHGELSSLMRSTEAQEITPDYPVSHALARPWMQPFIDEFVATGGNATAAAMSSGVHERTPYKAREVDKSFAEAWDWAERKVADAIRGEIYRRAVDGWDEPQFGMLPGKGAGEGEIGAVRKFDSSLLIKMATARVPEYRTLVKEGAAQITATASATTTVVVPSEKMTDLQARQQRILEKQAEREAKAAGTRN